MRLRPEKRARIIDVFRTCLVADEGANNTSSNPLDGFAGSLSGGERGIEGKQGRERKGRKGTESSGVTRGRGRRADRLG